MEFEIDLHELDGFVANLAKAPAMVQQELRTTAQAAGFLLQGAAINEAPVDRGFLKSKIGPPRVSVGGDGSLVELTSHAGYSKAVHDGTRAHTIYPSAKRALFWPGAEHPVRRVNHPGTKANPYMKRALDKTVARLTRLYAQMQSRIAEKALSA